MPYNPLLLNRFPLYPLQLMRRCSSGSGISWSLVRTPVQGGDGVWERLRIYNGRIFKLEEHLDRLFDSAKAMAFSGVPSRNEVLLDLSHSSGLSFQHVIEKRSEIRSFETSRPKQLSVLMLSWAWQMNQ